MCAFENRLQRVVINISPYFCSVDLNLKGLFSVRGKSRSKAFVSYMLRSCTHSFSGFFFEFMYFSC